MSRKRKYSSKYRAQVLKKMVDCENVSALARELGIARKFLYLWRDEARAAKTMPAADAEKEKLRKRVGELERLVGRQAAELDFFKGALQRVEGRRRRRTGTGDAASTNRSN